MGSVTEKQQAICAAMRLGGGDTYTLPERIDAALAEACEAVTSSMVVLNLAVITYQDNGAVTVSALLRTTP